MPLAGLVWRNDAKQGSQKVFASCGLPCSRDDLDKGGAQGELRMGLSEDNRTRGLLRYSFASRSIDEDSNVLAAGVILRELVAGAVTSSLGGISLVSDTRNDRLSPTEGYQIGGSIEYAGLGFFSKFARFEARATYYLGAPNWMPERSTFVVGTRFGWTLPFNVIGDYDLPEEVPHLWDSSAGAIAASGLWDLGEAVSDAEEKRRYHGAALTILETLCTDEFLPRKRPESRSSSKRPSPAASPSSRG